MNEDQQQRLRRFRYMMQFTPEDFLEWAETRGPLPLNMPGACAAESATGRASRIIEHATALKSAIHQMHHRNNELHNQLDALRAENKRLEAYIGKLTRPWWVRWWGPKG